MTPMLDFNVEGPTSARASGGGQPYDLTNSDDSHSFLVAKGKHFTYVLLKIPAKG